MGVRCWALSALQQSFSGRKREVWIISIISLLSIMQIAALSLSDGEAERFASCRFLIEGALVASGTCKVSAIGDDSYYVGFDNENVFVYLQKDEVEGFRGYWNEYESHAHTPMGMLSIDANCWSGEMASLCLK